MISIIAAIADDGTIGDNGSIPWDLPEDRRRFRRLTMGRSVIMGRKTFESLPDRLDGRDEIVLSRGPIKIPSSVSLARSLDEAIEIAGSDPAIIGGAEVYRQVLPLADEMHITHVHYEPDGDTRFPEWGREKWQEVERESGGLIFDYVKYRKAS